MIIRWSQRKREASLCSKEQKRESTQHSDVQICTMEKWIYCIFLPVFGVCLGRLTKGWLARLLFFSRSGTVFVTQLVMHFKSSNWIWIFDFLLKSLGIGNFHPLKICTRMSLVLFEQELNNSTSRDPLHPQLFCDSLTLLDVLPNWGENSRPLSFQNNIFKWIPCFSMNIIFNPLTDRDNAISLWREQKNLPEGSENV